MRLSVIIPAVAVLSLGACSGSGGGNDPLSEDTIRSEVETQLPSPLCLRMNLLRKLVDGEIQDTSNQRFLNALVDRKLLDRDGNTYELTTFGEEEYDPEQKTFCYSDGYEVLSFERLGVEDNTAGYKMSLRVKDADNWINSDDILNRASPRSQKAAKAISDAVEITGRITFLESQQKYTFSGGHIGDVSVSQAF